MADGQNIPPHQDLFHEQSQDFLPLTDLQRVGSEPQLGTETGEGFCQPQAMRLIGAGCFQRLSFGLHRLLLLAEFRHTRAQVL